MNLRYTTFFGLTSLTLASIFWVHTLEANIPQTAPGLDSALGTNLVSTIFFAGTIDGTTTVCVGDPMTLEAKPAASFKWGKEPVDFLTWKVNGVTVATKSNQFFTPDTSLAGIYTISCHGIPSPNSVSLTLSVVKVSQIIADQVSLVKDEPGGLITVTAQSFPAAQSLGCLQWEVQHNGGSWGAVPVSDLSGDTALLRSTSPAGEYIFKARNGENDPWKISQKLIIDSILDSISTDVLGTSVISSVPEAGEAETIYVAGGVGGFALEFTAKVFGDQDADIVWEGAVADSNDKKLATLILSADEE
jgi:hypothetical protein